MEESSDRELEAILNLVKLTQNGDVKWFTAKPWGDLAENETTKYKNVMYCEFKDKWLRLFVEKRRIDKPTGLGMVERNNALASIFMPDMNPTYPYWKEEVILEISNSSGQSLWRFPYKPAVKDLLDAAKYQVAGVRDVLDSLLRSSPNPSI